MRFIVGDDTGSLKWVRVEAHKVDKIGGSRRRGDAIERLCWAGPPGDREKRFAVGYLSGAVEVRDSMTGHVLGTCLPSPSRIRGLDALGDDLLRVSADGSASLIQDWCAEAFPEKTWEDDEEPEDEGSTKAPSEAVADAAPDAEAQPTEEGKEEGKEEPKQKGPPQRVFKLQAPIMDAKLQPGGSTRLAFGGLENDVKILDIATGEITWIAKNVRENFLCLRSTVKVACLDWATELCPSRDLLLCGTSDSRIRVYDTKLQRRPLFEYQIGFKVGKGSGGHTGCDDDLIRPLTCSTVGPGTAGGWSWFCANTMGNLREFDLKMLPTCETARISPGRKSHLDWARRKLPMKRGFKGIMGSIRGVAMHPNGTALTAVSLGRFAYVFETSKKKMVSKVYLKKKLSACLVSSELYAGVKPADDEDSGDITGKEEEPEDCKKNEAEDVVEGEDQVEEGFTSGEEGMQDLGEDGDVEEAVSGKKKKVKRGKRKLRRRRQDQEGDVADVESAADDDEPVDEEDVAGADGAADSAARSEPSAAEAEGRPRKRVRKVVTGARKRARKADV